MNTVEIKFGGSFTFGDDIIDPDADQNFYDILKRNLFSQNFDLKKVDYGRHGEGGYICIGKELRTYSHLPDFALSGYLGGAKIDETKYPESEKKFQKVSDIIDDSIDEYVDDFYNKQAKGQKNPCIK